MKRLSQKLIITGLYVLILAGPLLGFAAKGFAPMLAIAGTLALFGLLIEKERLKSIDWKLYWPAAPFLVYAFLSCFWSIGTGAFSSFSVMLSLLVFTFSLWQAFLTLPEEKQVAFKNRLSISLLFGIVCALAVGSYPVTYPELPILTEKWSRHVDFGNLQLLRQGNRSLSLMPVFLVLFAGFFWKRSKLLVIVLFGMALFVTYHSNSQTALLGMLMAVFFFIAAYFPTKKKRYWLMAAAIIGTIFSPYVFSKSFKNEWVEKYAPKIVTQKASGRDRQFIYYVFAEDLFERPIFGRGVKSSHSYRPDKFDDYFKLASELKLSSSHSLMRRNGDIQAHPHNFPLQILFEFGYLGVSLLFLALFSIKNLAYAPDHKPIISAALGASISLMLFAHSFWQSWLLAAVGFAFIYSQILYSSKKTI